MHKTFATVKRKNLSLKSSVSIIAIDEINGQPMLTLSSGLVIISNQFYVIFQKPVQHMSSLYFANIKRGCNVNVETVSDLVFSSCELSNIK